MTKSVRCMVFIGALAQVASSHHTLSSRRTRREFGGPAPKVDGCFVVAVTEDGVPDWLPHGWLTHVNFLNIVVQDESGRRTPPV
jgi:hypothetical protein